MTPPPSPPNRRRRRIVVATTVLVLVSMVSWWYWPRGDARFVGNWQLVWVAPPDETDELLKFDRAQEEAVGEFVFNANGSMDDCETFKHPYNYVQWSVRDGALVFHKRFHALPDWAIDAIRTQYMRWTGELINIGSDPCYDIREITPDVISIQARHQSAEHYQLRRIPE